MKDKVVHKRVYKQADPKYYREQYAYRISKNICVRCGSRKTLPESVHCDKCNTAINKNRGRAPFSYSKNNWNICCQACGFHRYDCQEFRPGPNESTKPLRPKVKIKLV